MPFLSPAAAAFALAALFLLPEKDRLRGYRLPLAALALLLLGEALSAAVLPGRPILGSGLFLPGSAPSRVLSPFLPESLSAVFRRAADPGIVLLLVTLAFLPAPFRIAAVSLTGMLIFELAALPELSGKPGFGLPLLALHRAFTLIFWLLLFGGFFLLLRKGSAADPEPLDLPRSPYSGPRFLLSGIVLAILLTSYPANRALRSGTRPLALAHYYSWFPDNWAARYSGMDSTPPLLPSLGLYTSGTEEVVGRHAEWARKAGIDCFVLDWWPSRRGIRDRVLRAADQLSSKEKLCTVLQYEMLDLRQPHEGLLPGERENIVFLSERRAKSMAEQWVRLVADYMAKPGYLRIAGRPVLFLYATRHLVGDVAARLSEARAFVREKTGEELFLAGDEVYFEVPAGDERAVRLLPTYAPNWNRLRAFDAVFAYNPYDNSRQQHGGEPGAARFIADTSELFRRYRSTAATLGVPFIPMAMPGYDDTAHRPKEGHFIIPRTLGGGESMMQRTLREWVRPALLDGSPFFLLTSWNEWNEGTQLEPAEARPGGSTPGEGSGGDTSPPDESLLRELCAFLGEEGRTAACG